MPETIFKSIDPKYSIRVICDDGEVEIVNQSGVPIPEHEPLIIFRARDRNALAMLRHYRELCVDDGCTDFHMNGIDNRIGAFQDFARKYPEKMKQPGITRGK